MKRWSFEDAKTRFDEMVRMVLHRPSDNLFDFLQSSPLAEAMAAGEFDLERTDDFGRNVDFD
jgi:hypothetical protein